jgi:lysophospholipase L1-like esterase
MTKILSLLSFFAILTISCSAPKTASTDKTSNTKKKQLYYLALGDSYTIGEAVPHEYSWPMMLSKNLKGYGYDFANPTVIAKTGWRSDNLIDSLEQIGVIDAKYNLVSLQIGVNNQYQGKSIEVFAKELKVLLEMAASYSSQGMEGVFMLSIPDYGVTPYGKRLKKEVSAEIKKYNTVCSEIASYFKVPFYDISRISKEAEQNSKLVADDKLHPSPAMYKLWTQKITPLVVQDILKKQEVK